MKRITKKKTGIITLTGVLGILGFTLCLIFIGVSTLGIGLGLLVLLSLLAIGIVSAWLLYRKTDAELAVDNSQKAQPERAEHIHQPQNVTTIHTNRDSLTVSANAHGLQVNGKQILQHGSPITTNNGKIAIVGNGGSARIIAAEGAKIENCIINQSDRYLWPW